MKINVVLSATFVMLVCGRANADPPGNFPLYRTTGEAIALNDFDENFATDAWSFEDNVLTGTAEIIPDIDDTITLGQLSAAAMGLGDYPAGLAGAWQTLEVLDNNVNSQYGGVLGMLMTVVGGNGSALAGATAGNGENNVGIQIVQNPTGVFVTYAGAPISISAGSGVPLEITLPVAPGEYINLFANGSVPGGTNAADQGSGTAAASAVPFDSPPLARIVVRSILGEIIDEWEADPPEEEPPCP